MVGEAKLFPLNEDMSDAEMYKRESTVHILERAHICGDSISASLGSKLVCLFFCMLYFPFFNFIGFNLRKNRCADIERDGRLVKKKPEILISQILGV